MRIVDLAKKKKTEKVIISDICFALNIMVDVKCMDLLFNLDSHRNKIKMTQNFQWNKSVSG